MSKKMLKRSLALGALMAFVITGSAMAKEFNGEAGTFSESDDKVIGGIYIKADNTDTPDSTNLNIDGGTVTKSTVGGNYNNNIRGEFNTISTTLNISDGTFGKVSGAPDIGSNWGYFYDIVTAGNYTKNQNKGEGNIVSNLKESNLIISGGNFEAPVFGGSVVDEYAGTQNIEHTTKVDVVNMTITGGTFNEGIFAGGLASSGNNYGGTLKSTVGTANLTIEGADITTDIYAGGAVRGENTAEITVASNVNVVGATINNIYGANGKYGTYQAGSGRDYYYTYDLLEKGDAVNTNLSLTNVTANTVDLPQGTLTLNGTNNVENVIIGEKVTNVKVDSAALEEGYSLQGSGNLEVKGSDTKLTITGINVGTYNIASGYATNELEKIAIDNESSLLKAEYVKEGNGYKVVVSANDSDKIATNLGVTENTGNFVKDIITDGNEEAKEFLDKLIENGAGNNAVISDTLNAVQKMGEAGGNSATAASIVKNVTGVTNDRLSFNCGHSAPHKGGHGVGLFEEGSGADIWVEYVHGKDEVEDMPSTAGASSYEGQYNGLVMGVDFKKVGKFQSGIAFNYGEGDTNSVGSAVRTHSDYDFWGVGYYGNIHNDDSNIIFDINYAQTESDVTQSSGAGTLEANPETTTWSAGVKLEKLYQNENVQIVPYTGLRYMSIDSDDYATKGGGFMYNMERQNIWMLPVGVSIRQEIQNDNGWTVSPRVDLSYIWAFGDTNSNMEVKVGNGITPIGYDVMDDGSFLGLVGIEAHKGQWGYGIAYSYQKGDHSESKKWYVDVNYSF
ncbi:MAG: autotransporter outer membrane beta-barrel domain-containing protein [Phascolarctobacterium sp.]|nr:autotransporter outer membrane beta-barrel domain-containing protein [Phascolarctobacterium sp.]